MPDPAHGVPLVERVLRHPATATLLDGPPMPMPPADLAAATFPSGRPLTPSLRAWLGYDTGLLARHGWFAADGTFAPRPLDRFVADELHPAWAAEFAALAERFDECFLLPGGSDSRRLLAVGAVDETGEYPVLALDFDDLPYLGLMYPGFDVYLGAAAGVLEFEFPEYTALVGHPIYSRRMREHGMRWFGGELEVQFPF
ncbi:hypothetical protein AB0H71_15965 [Nocardia sp. NPDC050697]|uniref:hypothetical protein n=1 Tax=Nocardia sp. NPDC050697 TaxID=3155158 RepID=UPI0033F6E8C2